jgi:fructose-bisphosphate aldolase class 1
MMMAKFPKTLTGADVSDIDLTKEEFVFHGERLTDERAKQLADKHFDRSRNLVPGAKSLSGGTKQGGAKSHVSRKSARRTDGC